MKIRIKFSREENVKFLGHLDIMRTFQRALIRANVKMIYSDGFNPHQKMSFAQPLGVGVTSSGEYLDVEIADDQNMEEILEKLDYQMGSGFNVSAIREVPGNAVKAMAAVRFASYRVTVEGNARLPEPSDFMEKETVNTVKKTKSGENEVNIRPLVYKLEKEGNTFSMILQAGSDNNLKPELLMQELFRVNGIEFDRFDLRIHRQDLMAENMVPLIDFQTL